MKIGRGTIAGRRVVVTATSTPAVPPPGPVVATGFTFTSGNGTAGTVGQANVFTVTPTPPGSVWPTGFAATFTETVIAGTFNPPSGVVSGAGSTPASVTWTPSGTGTATVSVANNSGLPNPSPLTYSVGAAPASSYSPLTGITWTQDAIDCDQMYENGDNYKPVIGHFEPIGGTGPFVFSISGGAYTLVDTYSGYRTNSSYHGYVAGPGSPPTAAQRNVTLTIKDALGTTVTKAVTINGGALAPLIWCNDTMLYPANINPPHIYCEAFTAGGAADNGQGIAITDPSGVWACDGGAVFTANGAAPAVGSYPITLHSNGSLGSLTCNRTLSIVPAVFGQQLFVQTLATLSTSVLPNTVVGHIIGTTPWNTGTYSMTETTGTLKINPATGVISVKAQPTSTGALPFTVTVTEGSGSRTDSCSVNVVTGTTLPATNMAFAPNALTNDKIGQAVGTPSVTGVTGTPQWTLVDWTDRNDTAAAYGTAQLFSIDASSGAITAPWWLPAGLDGSSAKTYSMTISCTDGINTCTQTFTSVSVAWAPVSHTFYIGRGQSTAYGAGVGFEHIADWRHYIAVTFNNSYQTPHIGTWQVYILADADPNYYASDTGTATSDYYCRFPITGPVIVDGVANGSVLQPRLGGNTNNNGPSGGDMAGKGYLNFGNSDAVLRNVEGSFVHGGADSGLSFCSKEGQTWGNFSLINCVIHDSDNGFLGGQWTQGEVLIDHCEFANCGTAHNGAGACHNVYVGECTLVTFTNSVSHGTMTGHNFKSRAMASTVHGNRFYDGLVGSASHAGVNFPYGGKIDVSNNVISKGAMAQNPDAIRILEEGIQYSYNVANISNNQIDVFTLTGNHFGPPNGIGHFPRTNSDGVRSVVNVTNNSVWLRSPATLWADYDPWTASQTTATGATVETGTTTRTAPLVMDTSTRAYLSGTLPTYGAMYRTTEWDSDNYSNLNGAGQYADRSFIAIAASTTVGTVICNVHATSDLDQSSNAWGPGTTWSFTTKPVYYSNQLPTPWAPSGRYGITSNADGSGTLTVAGALVSGVDYVQLRATGPTGGISDWRYPVTVT